jgi:hypothetical protein
MRKMLATLAACTGAAGNGGAAQNLLRCGSLNLSLHNSMASVGRGPFVDFDYVHSNGASHSPAPADGMEKVVPRAIGESKSNRIAIPCGRACLPVGATRVTELKSVSKQTLKTTGGLGLR